MSTGLNCQIVEYQPGEWYYLIERWDAPKLAWDWREHADARGPFPTAEDAVRHLQAHEPNPGGWTRIAYDAANPPDETVTKLVDLEWERKRRAQRPSHRRPR